MTATGGYSVTATFTGICFCSLPSVSTSVGAAAAATTVLPVMFSTSRPRLWELVDADLMGLSGRGDLEPHALPASPHAASPSAISLWVTVHGGKARLDSGKSNLAFPGVHLRGGKLQRSGRRTSAARTCFQFLARGTVTVTVAVLVLPAASRAS